MKYASIAVLFSTGLLAGCESTQAYMKMVDPACLAAPTGYVVKHDYPVVENKIAGAKTRCPIILVPVEIAERARSSQSVLGASENAINANYHTGLEQPEVGDQGGRENTGLPANAPSPTVTFEAVNVGNGTAAADQTTITGLDVVNAPDITVAARAGSVTIYSDGSVDMPSGHYE